ncbi:MAG: hybrid sensor histidine kinase/response regulator [Chloroflexi bacterium]|nr:MAG: hybrid sensor histidine kinase/response regulator [Chloroflexota bacterium]
MGTVMYNSERNSLELDGHELQNGDKVDIFVFGYWIPGQIALDTSGWHLLTPDQVEIRLHSGLTARHCQPGISPTPPPLPLEMNAPRILIVDDDPVLLHAGHGEHSLAIQALRGGAYDYILKPIDRDYFVAALRRAIQVQLLRRQVGEQQLALELHARLLEGLVQQQTHELFEAHAAKDKIIKVGSHMLKTPLTHLKEMTQLLRLKLGLKLEGINVPEMVSQGLADIEHCIEQMEMLVQELLHTSRIETLMFVLRRQHCNLVELCSHVLEEYAASTGCALICESLGAPIEVEVDEDRIGQLIISLLSTAHSNSTPGSPITVKLQQTVQRAIIAVSYKGSPPGLGMEFYISRKIVEQHGGRLEVQGVPENRSTYFIMLPYRIDPAEEQTDKVKQIQSTQALWTVTPAQ